jgi:transketolase C-terminal domain/subunit
VIDAYSLPLNTKGILDIATKSGGRIITVEDNYTGGLDAEIAIALATSGADIKFKNIVVAQVPKSGREPAEVLDYLHVGRKAILDQVG